MVETGSYEMWKRRTMAMEGSTEGLSMHTVC